jgi:preprotein translocase subunit SecY
MARGQIQIPISFFKTRKQNSSYLAKMRETGILKEYLPIQTNGSSMMPVIITLFMLDGINTLLGLFPGSLSVLKGSAVYSVLLFLGCVVVNMNELEDSVSKMGEYSLKVRVVLKPF